MDCLSAFEKFLHNDPVRTPVLTSPALAHVQFETIHPLLDGNGRVGRLPITLLIAEGALSEPILYLSLYFKTHRNVYYDLLQQVRTEGDCEGWLRFFLNGVLETSNQAVETARAILKLIEEDSRRIEALGRPAASALRVHQYLQRKPLTTISLECQFEDLCLCDGIPGQAAKADFGQSVATRWLERDSNF